jgi:hypothetical protein
MTELFVNCKKHGRTHVKEWILSGSFFTECGCEFLFNSGYVRNLTEERKEEEYNKLYPYDDPRGVMCSRWRLCIGDVKHESKIN